MTLLPIVERELRVAARKRSTFWVRIIAALVALILGVGFLCLSGVGRFGMGMTSLGKGLFTTLTWLSLAACLSAGLFFTCDCLSEEKREGTIGFLFLTDLSGFDVVLGKLLATSLRGFYALLAVLPILAVTVLMGGVTGMQFWKTALALVNALFLSLVAGLFVSAISRDSQKALAATLVLLAALIGGGLAGDAIWAALQQRAFHPQLSLSSPGFLFVTAGAWGRTPFWSGLLVNQALAWLLLGLTARLIPRTWQEKATKTATGTWQRWGQLGVRKASTARHRKPIAGNPVLWLVRRELRWLTVALWSLSLLMMSGAAATWASDPSIWWFLWSYVSGTFSFVLSLGMASQAGRFFVETQRSGLLELMMVTPLTVNQIVQGPWRALLRMSALPLVLCLAAQCAGTVMVQRTTWSRMAAATAATPGAATTTASTRTLTITNKTIVTTTATGTTKVSAPGLTAPTFPLMWGAAIAATLTAAANLAALIWVGMWMGMNSKNTSLATLKAIVFVQLIPWFVISFVSALTIPLLLLPSFMRGVSTAPLRFMTWYPLFTSLVTTVLSLGKDGAFIFWARKKLYFQLRERAASASASVPTALPPPLPPAAARRVTAPT